MADENFLRPICKGWANKIEAAKRKKEDWQKIADECMRFFCAASGWMWKPEYSKDIFPEGYAPTFRLTIAKAFELVALFGPNLYWRNPVRTVKPKKKLEVPIEALGNPVDPLIQQTYQAIQASASQESANSELVSQLTSLWLNYTPDEQPNGGLKSDAQLAITDALIKGRGCLISEIYHMPGSDKNLTGSFYLSPDDLFIDPDATSMADAKWIAVRCVEPIWEIERKYNLPDGALKKYGNTETYAGASERNGSYDGDNQKKKGESYDAGTYYKIWSKGGVGHRLTGTNSQYKEIFDQFGDYAYMAIMEGGGDYPLNLSPDMVQMDLESVAQALSWPIAFWRDDRWPVANVDFYPQPGSPWPIAPLAPGLGELKFINLVMSHLCTRIVNSSRTFIATPQSVREEIESLYKKGSDLCVFPVPQIVDQTGRAIVEFLQVPPVNMDIWNIVDRVMQMFDKRVGLNELYYGMNPGAASRTAEDAAIKRQSLNVRPDWMASCVEDWMTECARLENIAMHHFVTPNDVVDVMGVAGAQLWQTYITSQPIETVLRETVVGIEAGTARKPNKDRDVANISQALPIFMPVLQQYATTTGDSRPINIMLRQWADANDFEAKGLEVGPWMPPMPPPGMMPPPVPEGAPPSQQ